MFTDYQIVQIEEHGITLQSAQNQVELFKKGAPFLNLYRPATPGDGILVFSLDQLSQLADLFEKRAENLSIAKFVPASGAATRMFKDLFEYLDENETKSVSEKFFTKLHEFPFFELLLKQQNISTSNFDANQLSNEQKHTIIKQLLTEKGLNYGNLPKGLLLFHRYGDECRTAFEEHLVEGSGYASSNKEVNLYLTVSPEHMMNFIVLFDEVKLKYEQQFGVRYKLSCSMQKAATDTLAVNTDNEPFEDEGQLIFRPGGHGALLENLNEITEDIIFIKNIDNVAPDALKPASYLYKKALAGLLIKTRDRIFEILQELEDKTPTHSRLQELTNEVCSKFQICYPGKTETDNDEILADFLWQMLYRPIRVCGMVRNVGEPGGGPFWAADKNGNASLQIVETSQVDPKDEKQQQILKSATHFNPVDLVCAVKDFHGRKFDLTKYKDPNAFFISRKSKNGRELKALELPGLWNGAMSDWITLFVEVPAITFNPVKTVFDLLRPEHQANSKQETLSNCDC